MKLKGKVALITGGARGIGKAVALAYVSIEDSVKVFVGELIKEFGRIDVLVDNAGVMIRPVPITQLEVRTVSHN